MPSALRLLAAVLQQLSAGDLNNIDALLGCPLAMPDARMFTDGRCAACVRHLLLSFVSALAALVVSPLQVSCRLYVCVFCWHCVLGRCAC
jgi:hypothetical protein